MAKIHEITVKAPINIALIKYWGKRNEKLILPLNDSISVSIDELFATTRIYIGSHIEENSITVNGRKLDQGHMQRFEMAFQECEKLVYRRKRQAVEDFAWTNWHMEIDSRTNFPTSAGLASSAAGFAAIAFGIGQIFGFDEKDIVRLARIGSGSACRSIQSGFVHWRAGFLDKDDSDCICETIDPVKHWPELRAMIFVVSQDQKKMGSTEAMRNSVNSSELLAHRAQDIVPRRVEKLKQAIIAKDFARLAQVTMAESNQLHAICLDTMPPVNYLNATSHDLMEFVHAFNSTFGTRLAYTFDAGPNCCLLLEEETIPLLALAFKHCFTFECHQFPAVEDSQNTDEEMRAKIVGIPWPSSRQIQIERIIVSKIGGGPAVLGSCSSPNIV